MLSFYTDGKLLVGGLLLLYNSRVYNYDNNIECNYPTVSNIFQIYVRNIRANKQPFCHFLSRLHQTQFPCSSVALSDIQRNNHTWLSRIVKTNTSSVRLIIKILKVYPARQFIESKQLNIFLISEKMTINNTMHGSLFLHREPYYFAVKRGKNYLPSSKTRETKS